MRNWMIAGACAIATAWGIAGCSSNNAAAPAAPGEPTDLAPTQPVEPDDPAGSMDPEPDDMTPEEETSTQWSAQENLVRLPVPAALPEVRVVRRIRTNEAGNANSPDLLDEDSFLAVPYEPGKILISEGEASSGDRLRMRGHFVERINNLTRKLSIATAPGTIFSALKITEAGLVMEMGGRQAEGMDFRRVVDIARNQGGPSAIGAGVDDLSMRRPRLSV